MRLKDIMKDKPRISKEVKELRAELKNIEKKIKTLSETDREFVLRDYVKKEPKKRQPTEWELFMEKHGIRAVCDKCGCVQTYMHAVRLSMMGDTFLEKIKNLLQIFSCQGGAAVQSYLDKAVYDIIFTGH